MKNRKRIFWIIVITILVMAGVVGTNIVKRNTYIESVSVVLQKKKEAFITEKEILHIVEKKIGKIQGKQIKDLDVGDIETLLLQNPYLSKADFHTGITGKVVITVRQREPVVQIFNVFGEHFWLDSVGYYMPPSVHAIPNTIVANGNIPCKVSEIANGHINTDNMEAKNKCSSILSKILYIALSIEKDSLLCCQIDQIYVNSPRDFHLTPKIGSGIIEIGDVENLRQKLYKLKHLYSEGFLYDGWDRYRKINLEFKDQVVCTKK